MSAGEDRPDKAAHEKLERDARGSAQDQARTALLQRVENDFRYHAPRPEQLAIYGDIRDRAKDFAKALIVHCPHSRELSTALTQLDSVVMNANA